MSDPSRARVSGPLESYAPGFVAELLGAGYRPVSASFQLQLMAHLSRWMQASEVEPGALSGEELERFLAARRAAGYTNYLSPKALVPLVRYLRGLGVVPAAEPPVLSAVDALLERYRAFLLAERGLADVTAVLYADLARPFLASRLDAAGRLDLAGLAPSDVLAFVLAQAERRPRRSAKLLVTVLRSLLGFLHVEGLIGAPAGAGGAVGRGWRLSGLPRASGGRSRCSALLASCDRARPRSGGATSRSCCCWCGWGCARRGRRAAARRHRLARRRVRRARQGPPGRAAAVAGRCRRGDRGLSAPRPAAAGAGPGGVRARRRAARGD